jgi:hypothetical protein
MVNDWLFKDDRFDVIKLCGFVGFIISVVVVNAVSEYLGVLFALKETAPVVFNICNLDTDDFGPKLIPVVAIKDFVLKTFYINFKKLYLGYFIFGK